LISDY